LQHLPAKDGALQLAVVADDLTGALDTAAPFAARGLRTIVVADPSELKDALAENFDVISLTTLSREVEPEEAARRVAEAVVALPPDVRLFKKIDSRMKGNLEAELSALPPQELLVVPGIPEFGRVVRAGKIEGFGVEKPTSVAAALGRFAARALVPDTETREDMARALAAAGGRLLVGARGAAEALATQITGREMPAAMSLPKAPTMMVIGSRDPITLAQVEVLRGAHPHLHYVPAPNGRAVFDESASRPALTLLQAVPGEKNASAEEVSAALAESLGRFRADISGILVLTGGATAEKVLNRLKIGRMRLVGEFLPGLPVSQAGELLVLTKSGGFGEADTLKRIADCALASQRDQAHVL
jgi:D-threonate/D-erythronate kinase